jgi:hypothetical protein
MLLCAAPFWYSCGDPITTVEREEFFFLSLSGSKETPAIKKLNMESTDDTTFYITMTYAGTTNYERGDISATLEKAPSLVETFNAANKTAYRLLPDEAFSFDRTDLRISNGKNISEAVRLTIKMKTIDLNYDYLLPVVLTSVSGGEMPLNEDLKTLYLAFQGNVDDDKGKSRWSIAGSSSEQQDGTAEKVFDDDRNTFWHSDPNGAMPQWFAVNMQGFKRISGFTWVNRTDPAQKALPRHVKFETSMNGREWTEALDVPELGESRVLQVFPLGRTIIAKFFRVTVLSNRADAPYTYVSEVDIYSGDAPEPEIDWAKHEWELVDVSSEWNSVDWTARNTFDGKINTTWHTEPFDVSKNGMPQWFIVDLKNSFMIHGFLLWNRQEDHGNEPKNIVFETSDDLVNWKLLLDEPEMSNAYDKELNLSATNPQRGRYLRVTVKTNWGNGAWTYIAELSLY